MPVTDRGENSTDDSSRIVFHADDLGMSDAVDRGIVQAFRQGVLTSTSVLANGPTAAAGIAAVQAIAPPEVHAFLPSATRRQALNDPNAPFDLGIHLNLTQGKPLTGNRYPSELLDARGCFLSPGRLLIATLRLRESQGVAIHNELEAQIDFVRDHGVEPTHANGHQYIEMFPRIGPIVVELLSRKAIPVVRWAHERYLATTAIRSRGVAPWLLAHMKRRFAKNIFSCVKSAHLAHADEYFGTAHAGRVDLPVLAKWLNRITMKSGSDRKLLEIGIHPACVGDAQASAIGWEDPLASLRPAELALLCSDSLVATLRDRRLRLGRLSSLTSRR